ncbi:hypothetical protein E6H32_05275 [Candidatus Bathyarchaeota archaeon]|nr:MAG: hypothetical protein E6H32_05275 [Candidatus Bathyarchaeota archaeon]
MNAQISSLNTQISQIQTFNSQLGGTNSNLVARIGTTPIPGKPVRSSSFKPDPDMEPATKQGR